MTEADKSFSMTSDEDRRRAARLRRRAQHLREFLDKVNRDYEEFLARP